MVADLSASSQYVPFPGTVQKPYALIKPFMTHVPKNALLSNCVGCQTLPAFGSNLGIDGFSVPVSNLNGGTVAENRSLWPGMKFQALKVRKLAIFEQMLLPRVFVSYVIFVCGCCVRSN